MNRTTILLVFLLSLPATRAFGQVSGEIRPRFNPASLSLSSAVSVLMNPAAIAFDEPANIIRLGPTIATSDGSYRRLFDPEEVQSYSFGASVVNVLGNRGTFRGSASYVYEDRHRVFAAVRMNPYGGDGFTATDTSAGDFRYMGPRVNVEYAYEPMTNVSTGFVLSYEVLDGLKGYYSHAHTVSRDISYGFGIQYVFDQTGKVGAVARGIDQQEKIESKSSDDLMDVEIFSYRGDTYATKRRGSAVKETYRVKGWELLAEGRIDLVPELTVFGNGSYREAGLWSLFPSGLTQEFEDGYAQQRRVTGEAGVEWRLASDVALTGRIDGYQSESWSMVSSRSLLMWEWDYSHVDAMLGVAASLFDDLRVRGEGWMRTGNIDSTKYIDAKESSHTLGGKGALARMEYSCDENVRVALSGWMNTADYDVMTGGTDAVNAGIRTAIVWKATPRFELEVGIGWQTSRGTVAGTLLDRAGRTYSLMIQIPQD